MITTFWFNELFGKWGWLIALTIAISVNIPIFIWARLKKHLTLFGCFLAGFFGISFLMMNPVFYLLLFTFFISSSVLTNFRLKDKKDTMEKFAKGGERDTSQVLANGLMAFIFAFCYLLTFLFSNNSIIANAFVYAFIAAIATTNADTWATEIGILSQGQPYWILDLRKKVEKGTSGGVSIMGTSASLLGAIVIGGITMLIESFWNNLLIPVITWELYVFLAIATIMGFFGALFDSVLGATIQGFFKCTLCGKGTEKRIHCNTETVITRGKEWFRNDHVNFWASFFAGIITFGLSCFAYLI